MRTHDRNRWQLLVVALAAGVACDDPTRPEERAAPAPTEAVTAAAVVNADAPPLLYACYRPKKGDVYRVRQADTKQDCDKDDVLFSWNAVGPGGLPGERGEKGEQGAQGQPGNLALAGQSCPTGFFVSGFSSTGSIICRNSAGEEPHDPPPPPPPPGAYDGGWTVAPRLSSHCGFFFEFDVNAVDTQVSGSTLTLTLKGGVGALSIPYSLLMPLAYNEATHEFQGSAMGNKSVGDVDLTVSFTVSGQFVSTSRFTATVAATGHTDNSLTGRQNCDPINTTVTGSRVS